MEPEPQRSSTDLAHLVLGVGSGAWQLASWATRPFRRLGGGILDGMVAAGQSTGVLDRGRHARGELERVGLVLVQLLVDRAMEIVLPLLDLTEAVRAHVDLDALVAAVDLDAVVRRIDLNTAAAGLDLDALVATVDLDAVVGRVDLDAVVGRVDLDAVVRRVDLDAVVGLVDLDVVVGRVDLDAAIARVDLVGIAREVIAAIDLPEIVRDSTGALSSDAVRTIRAEGMHADDAVAGFVDRMLRRRRAEPVVP
ncbi:MAG: hypothetical protein QOI16_1713 [Pseudonocardiales bacterium]|jgi:hypothetical protein|nr:hypothetical protein [Pseudonocardiales bacterium]